MTKKVKLDRVRADHPAKTLDTVRPASNSKVIFSFVCLDRTHELFNLGGEDEDGTVGGPWFVGLLDCLKEVSGMTYPELIQSKKFQFHPVKWEGTNARKPRELEQHEFWQFRISKSEGRVIGFKIEDVFYVVWLDAHHNLTDSDGYGKAKYFAQPLSDYEDLQRKYDELKKEYDSAMETLDERTRPTVNP